MNRRSTKLARNIPVTGDTVALLARQAHIPAPGKLIPGPQLRIELPMLKEPESQQLLDAVLKVWRNPSHTPAQVLTPARQAILDEAHCRLTQLGFPGLAICWSIQTLELSDAHTEPRWWTWVCLQQDVTRIEQLSPEGQTALVHYLLHVNRHLRGCRASLADGVVTVEAFLMPEDILNDRPPILNQLNNLAAMLNRALSWFKRPDVIQRYRSFHRLMKGGEDHEPDRRSSGLVPIPWNG